MKFLLTFFVLAGALALVLGADNATVAGNVTVPDNSTGVAVASGNSTEPTQYYNWLCDWPDFMVSNATVVVPTVFVGVGITAAVVLVAGLIAICVATNPNAYTRL